MSGAPWTPEDTLRHQTIAELQGSPAEELLVCTVQSHNAAADRMDSALWCVPLDGSGPPWPLTSGTTHDNGPRWSPDGTRIAFVSSRAGRSQAFVIPRHGGEARQVGVLDGTVLSAQWSPDGTRLAVLCTVAVDPDLRGRRPPADAPPPRTGGPRVVWRLPYKADGLGYVLAQETHLFVLQVDGGRCLRLTDGAFNVRAAAWSPDGTQLAFVRTRDSDTDGHRTDLWTLPATGGHARQLTHDLAQVLSPVWSPDGRTLVFSGSSRDGDAQVRLWQCDAETARAEPLGDDTIEVGAETASVRFAEGDPGRVLAVIQRRGAHAVVSIALPGGEVRTLAQGDRQMKALAHTRERLAFLAFTPVEPMEIHACTHEGQGEQKVTAFNAAWWEPHARATLERRRFMVPDGEGGTHGIDGWLLRPPGARGATPLLVDLHGGPAAHALFDYPATAYWSVLWSRGWSVLALNPSGSSGYGHAFAERLAGHWGERDLPEVLAAVEALRGEGLADERMAVCGKSYGGFLSAWALGHTDRFRTAVVMAPVADARSHYGLSDSGYYADPFDFGGTPWSAPQAYLRASTLPGAARSRTPTLILQGENDQRCPVGQSEALFCALKRGANPPCELVIYPGEGHTFTVSGAPSVRRDAVQRIVEWVERWVDEPLAPPQED
ncbi:S9 family peptidase [Acidovorax sp. GBBC 3334]|uniref:S9 family peptidase n=1 Tax=Acidovorax sp. GBBC 3334 TaxID=2940496 RepID=UPI002303F95E|nr:S9 family peptidase [Acidovorax sp. GBBC 3334]MDA8453354.1 S9 family peptidase [Acidovorax sp. GBBC 3334]